MKLTLGFSPCPNDTFIFDAMVHGRIDTEGLEFDYLMADIQELNNKAFSGNLDITKISLYAYAYAANNYLILDSGSALGHKNGPLLISKRNLSISEISDARIAIPGKHTTANMLFTIFWPEAVNKAEYLFSDVEEAILRDEADAGLIIHEKRFTYHRKGLSKVADLGEYWEKLTSLPIPLGTIAVNRRVPYETALKVNRIIHRSLEYAYHDSLASYDFIVANAQEMDSTVMNKHIKLFVNKFTSNLGKEGKKAIIELLRIAGEKRIIPGLPVKIFLTD
ncbi:MAG: 1,4-dihydroxy-6-naphthoate synthase [Bacteroidetes bacterium RBG_13_43_22]|nr:MAG: 1,4-dihydroxy-6-naphthoate synthase [Bacteroidetes bacterium RBG_13_43_22]